MEAVPNLHSQQIIKSHTFLMTEIHILHCENYVEKRIQNIAADRFFLEGWKKVILSVGLEEVRSELWEVRATELMRRRALNKSRNLRIDQNQPTIRRFEGH